MSIILEKADCCRKTIKTDFGTALKCQKSSNAKGKELEMACACTGSRQQRRANLFHESQGYQCANNWDVVFRLQRDEGIMYKLPIRAR